MLFDVKAIHRFLYLVGFTLGGFAVAAQVAAQTYSATWDKADWSLVASPFGCRLTQKIPGLGAASLSRKGNEEEALSFKFDQALSLPSGGVRVDAQPLSWHPETTPRLLMRMPALNVQSPFTGELLAMMVEQLSAGRQIVVSGLERTDKGKIMRVLLQPREFKPTYESYAGCTRQLIPYSFDDVARTNLYYGVDDQQLSSSSKAKIDKLVRYMLADKKVLGVIIDAHSDLRTGEEDAEKVSQFEADLVANYFKAKGIAEEKISARSHGAKFPVATNALTSGRAKNRRITLRLENSSTRALQEKRVAEFKKRQALQQAQQAEAQAQEKSAPKGLTLEDLQRMVETQDLNSGKQPALESKADEQAVNH